jgi:hypothetical protein
MRSAAPGQRLAARWTACAFALGLATSSAANDLPTRRLYQMSTHTGMPHLDENLRYAVVNEQRCLDPNDLSGAFWMLDDVSLRDCKLAKLSQSPTGASYVLQCNAGHGTSGDATWQFTPRQLTGVMNVRLGGKNMTFYQRITAAPVGECR